LQQTLTIISWPAKQPSKDSNLPLDVFWGAAELAQAGG